MFLSKQMRPLFSLALLIFLSGCNRKKEVATSSKPQGSAAKTKSKQRKSKNEAASLLAESSVMYNYGPEAFLNDDFDASYLENLALSDNQAYQLKSANGSQLPETTSQELEKLAMAWETKSSKVDEAFQLWADSGSEFDDSEGFKTVFFDFERSEIDDANKDAIEENYKNAQKAHNQGKKLLVRGHCDPSEPEGQSFSLSFDRAKAVKNELVKMGLEPSSIEIVAMGSQEPIVWADEPLEEVDSDDQTQPCNCRAEIISA